MVSMIVLNEMNLGGALGALGWDTALFSNVSLSAGSIAMYTLEALFAEGTVPPELFYYWNMANYYNQEYG